MKSNTPITQTAPSPCRKMLVRSLAIFAVGLAIGHPARAQDSLWEGATGNWTTGFTPSLTTGANMVFGNATGGTATNDISSGTLSSIGSITFNSTAGAFTLDANSGSAGFNATTALAVTGSIINNSTNLQTISTALSFAATRTVDAASGNMAIGGGVSGAGGLTKSGTGTLLLTGNNSYTGVTTINSGTLRIGNGTSGSIDSTSSIVNNANLVFDNSSGYTIKPVTGSGSLSANATTNGFTTLGGNITQSGTVSISTVTTLGNSAGLRQSDNTTITASSISITGQLGSNGGGSNSKVLTLDTSSTNGSILLDFYNGSSGRTFAGAASIVANAGTGNVTVGAQAGRFSESGAWQPASLTGGINITAAFAQGALSVNTLTLNATAASTISSNLTFNSNTANNWTVSPGVTMSVSGRLAGSNASITKNGTGTLVYSGNNSYTGATTINEGILEVAATGRLGAGNYSANITNNGSFLFGSNSNQILSGVISGTGGLTKNGTGTLTLSGVNTYTGATNLNGGMINIGQADSLGSTGNLTFGGGGLQYGTGITADLSARIKNSTGRILIDTNGQEVTFASALDSSNSGGLTKNGTGTLFLTNASNSYTGGTTLNGGTIQIDTANSLGSSGNLTFGGGTLKYGSGVTQDFSSRLKDSASAIRIDTNSNNVTYASAVDSTNSGGLTKDGAGTLTLSGNNTYTGTTTVNAGTLAMTGATVSTGTGAVAIGSGSNLVLNNASGSFTLGSITGAGNYNATVGTYFMNGNITTTGNVNIAAGVAGSGGLRLGGSNNGGSRTITANSIRVTGQTGDNFGAGTLVFDTSAANGNIYLDLANGLSGTLYINNITANAGTGNLTLAGTNGANSNSGQGWVRTNTLTGALNISTNFASGAAGAAAGTWNLTATGASSITGNLGLASNTTSTWTVNPGVTMDVSGRLSGSNGSLTKAGTGTLVYSANNTYSGATLVSAGTLLVNGSLAAGSSFTVASGATLGGSGVINGAATVNGNLEPGNSPGVLKFGSSLNLGSTSQVTMELNGTARGTQYDGIDVTGALTYGGALAINVGSAFLASNQNFSLFTFGSQSGDLASVSLAGAYGAGSFANASGVWSLTDSAGNQWSYSQATGNLGFTAVPEPSTWALLVVFGLACAGWKVRAIKRAAAKQTANPA